MAEPGRARAVFYDCAPGGVLVFWGLAAVSNDFWASAVVERVAKRVHWDVPADVAALVTQGSEEQGRAKAVELWIKRQRRVVDQANHFILFQPTYQIAVLGFPLMAAGWRLETGRVTLT